MLSLAAFVISCDFAFAGFLLASEVDTVTLELASSDRADRLFADWMS